MNYMCIRTFGVNIRYVIGYLTEYMQNTEHLSKDIIFVLVTTVLNHLLTSEPSVVFPALSTLYIFIKMEVLALRRN